MKHTTRGIAFLLLVALLVLSPPLRALAADTTPLAISETRTDTYPKVVIRLTVNNDGSLGPGRTFTDRDFVVEENGQKVEPLIVRRLQDEKNPISIVLAIDISGSMNDEGKLQKAKDAAKVFIAQLRPIDQVELITFSDKVTSVTSFTSDHDILDKAIGDLTAKGNTAFYDAADRAVSDVIRAQGSRVVILLADGEDNASKVPIAQTIDRARQSTVLVFTIGLGANIKDDVLNRIAIDTGARYYKAPKPEDLTYTFKLLSQQLANRYEITYYSPIDKIGGKVDVVVRAVWNNQSKAETKSTYVAPARQIIDTKPETLIPIDPGILRLVVDPPPPPAPAASVSEPLPWYAGYADVLAACLGSLGIVALFAGTSMRLIRGPMEARLATFVETTRPSRSRAKKASGSRLVMGAARSLSGRVSKFLPARQIESMREKLSLAGNPYNWGVEEFLGIRTLLGIVLGGYVYAIMMRNGQLQALGFGAIMAALGFLLPSIWLGRKIKARQKAIFRAMPNALDLLAASVEAGLGFDQAIGEVCQKWHNALTEEFEILLAELRMGRSRREALKGLMDRTGVPELGAFASALIQADELGASIARTLIVQAETIRMRRRQRAEEQARQAGIKMLFPLVFLMLPSIFVVILGPSIPIFIEGFGQALK